MFCLISLDVHAAACKLGRDCGGESSGVGRSSRANAGCDSDADCEGSICDTKTRRCVSPCDPKVFKQTCTGDTPRCVVVDGKAQCGCTENNQCKGTYKYCSSQHECSECTKDEHCPVNERCNSVSFKCEPIPCEVENCTECVIGDGTKCATCAESFKLDNGQCTSCDVSVIKDYFENGTCNTCSYSAGDAVCTSATCNVGYEFNSTTGLCEKQICVGNEVFIEGVGCTEDYCQSLTGLCAKGDSINYYWTNNTEKKACCCETDATSTSVSTGTPSVYSGSSSGGTGAGGGAGNKTCMGTDGRLVANCTPNNVVSAR